MSSGKWVDIGGMRKKSRELYNAVTVMVDSDILNHGTVESSGHGYVQFIKEKDSIHSLLFVCFSGHESRMAVV